MLKALFVALFLLLGEVTGLTLFAALYVPGYSLHLAVSFPVTVPQVFEWLNLVVATVVFPVGIAKFGSKTFDAHFKG